MKKINYKKFNRIFFCGVCGVSMSGLAKHLSAKGFIVGGSDKDVCELGESLSQMGIEIYQGHSHKNILHFAPDLVVYSSAVSLKNAELTLAKEMGIPVIKRSQLLGSVLEDFAKSIAVSGCHGKTTTTSMISQVLISSGVKPTVFLGGQSHEFGNYLKGENSICVCEACEYQKNFLDLTPTHAVVLNVDNDHMDTYKDLSDLINSFSQFIEKSINIINADDPLSSKLTNKTSITFGLFNNATYRAKKICYSQKSAQFTLYRNNIRLTRIKLKVLGEHNVYNALATCAICDEIGVSLHHIKKGLETFCGVKRRMETIAKINDKLYIADYAHHPTEINVTIKTLSQKTNALDNDVYVFQPHTFSRTALLMQDFVEVFSKVKNLILYKTYPAREKYDSRGSAKSLYENIKNQCNINVFYCENETELEKALALFSDYKRVIFLGAGDIYDVAKRIIK